MSLGTGTISGALQDWANLSNSSKLAVCEFIRQYKNMCTVALTLNRLQRQRPNEPVVEFGA
ncbi:MAG TPA: hypothetical protein VN201_11220 [Roseateles sp.]|nr:hypothetical protein [Roseateles sp.]